MAEAGSFACRAKTLTNRRIGNDPVGDVLMTTERLVHRGTPNTADTVRWSVDTRYCQLGLPTGRESVPGFVARSRENPASVTGDCEEWNRIYAAGGI